jgi:integrase
MAADRWDDSDRVWCSQVGTPLGHRNVLRTLYVACDRAGIRRVSFHTLRHSAATVLLAQGIPERTIMDVLGHADSRQLGTYLKVVDSLRQDAADVMETVYGRSAVKPAVKSSP